MLNVPGPPAVMSNLIATDLTAVHPARTPLSSLAVANRMQTLPSHVDKAATRKLLAQSGAKGIDDTPTPATRSRKGAGGKGVGAGGFKALDLVELARLGIAHQPFNTTHGSKGATWTAIRNALVTSCGAHLDDLSTIAVQHKMEGLVAYKKNPDSADCEVKFIATLLKGTSYDITIQSSLERLEQQWDDAKDKSDAVKEKLRKKQEEDTVGAPEVFTTTASASALPLTSSSAADNVKHGADVKLEANTNTEPPAKRRRQSVRRESSGNSAELLQTIKEDSHKRQAHQKRVVEYMERDKSGRMT
ncbi:hypothetical protein CPB85DRAFT_1429532 [Mucidula mucida]|nr:hypothetical protein CPB85DRAFT_1429532 [Mucidula mucida]